MMLRIAGIVNESIVDGPGIRLTVFVQGCPHHCPGCHNKHTHDFDAGSMISIDEILERVRNNPLLDGVTFSGGEPFCQAQALAELGIKLKSMGMNIITYTGWTFEELLAKADERTMALLNVTDFLVDGPFIESQKSYQLQFRGSSNQRVLDCKASLELRSAISTEFQ